MTDTALPETPTAPPPAPSRKPSRLRRFIAAAGALLLLVGVLLAWLLGSQSGLRFSLTTLPSWFGADIRIAQIQGSWWRGFQAQDIALSSEESDVRISRFDFDWDAAQLRQRHLHIRRLAAGDIDIISKNAPPREREERPIRPPEDLHLPLTVQIDRIETGHIRSGQAQNVLLYPSAARYGYDGQQHHIQLIAISTPWQKASGDLKLAADKPFPLTAVVHGQGVSEEGVVSGHLTAGGTLTDLTLDSHWQGGERGRLDIQGLLHPYAPALGGRLTRLHIQGQHLNPKLFAADLPQADLHFELQAQGTTADAFAGHLKLHNQQAAALPDNGLPLAELTGQWDIDAQGHIRLHDWLAKLPQDGGYIGLNGLVDSQNETWQADLAVGRVDAAKWLTASLPRLISGSLHGRGSFNEPELHISLAAGSTLISGRLNVHTDKQARQQTLTVHELAIHPANGGVMQAEAKLELFGQRALQADIVSHRFNPAALDARLSEGSINGGIALRGTLADGGDIQASMDWKDSTLNNAPLNGRADLVWREQHLARADIAFALGNNRINTSGGLGQRDSRLNLDIDTPNLALFGFGLTGNLKAQGHAAGTFERLSADLRGQAAGVKVGNALEVGQLQFHTIASPDLDAPLRLDINGQNVHAGGTQIRQIHVDAQGSGRRHRVIADSSLNLDGQAYTVNLNAEGGLNQDAAWQGRIGRLDVGGAFNLKLLNPINLLAGAEKVETGGANWSLMGGSLNLERLTWNARQGLQTKGSAQRLQMQQLQRLLERGGNSNSLQQDLVLSLQWDVNYSQNATGYLKLTQDAGDIVLPYRRQALGLERLVLDSRLSSGRIANRLTTDTRYGQVQADIDISQTFGNAIGQAPINGKLQVAIPDLDRLRNLLPHGMSVKGRLDIDTIVSGTVGEPRLNGNATGSELYYRDRNTGVILDHGSLASRFQGRDWLIDSLAFTRKEGRIELKGRVNLTGTTPDVDVRADATRYPLLDTPNRKLTLSGHTRLLYTPERGMALEGALKADSGHFGFQKSSMPDLDDDVVIEGEDNPKQAQAPMPFAMNLDLDLNDSFRFSGEGLDVMLGGRLKLTAQPKEDIRAVGTVNIVRGQYKAYGQDLLIEQGNISFVGDLSNPNLNLRATRNLSPVGAGVEVLGSLANPRVSLIANEPMSDKDKLTWLILGRASSGSESDEAAVAAAAGAFLVGNINDKVGLVDDFGMTTRRTRNRQTGELHPAEQIITFGKRLSNELYLGYEYSITSSNQAVKLIWQLNAALQFIGRLGTDSSGGEVRYTIRFD